MLKKEHLEGKRGLLGCFAAIFALTFLHLIPFPPGIVVSGDGNFQMAASALANGSGGWQPLAVMPTKAWDALTSLAVPLAVLLLGIQLSRDELFRLLPLMVGLGVVSGLLGLLQIVGSTDSPLYLYRITNAGSAVGLFANRNHAAAFLACLFPMLAVFAATGARSPNFDTRRISAAAFAAILVPLLLVTGSRSGLLLAVFGFVLAMLLYYLIHQQDRQPKWAASFKLGSTLIVTSVSAIILASATLFFSRAVAIDRFFLIEIGETQRADVWAITSRMLPDYLPAGSGSGSFPDVFLLHEPVAMLDPTYLNRAHNDWIEIAVTFGIAGIILAGIIVLLFARHAIKNWRSRRKTKSIIFARLASVNLGILALASISDYPLRTPAFMAFAALLTLWLVNVDKPQHSTS